MPGVELFDFHDISELSHDSELQASEALAVGVPRTALVLSAITRRNVQGSVVRFELVDRRDIPTEGCDLFDLTVPVPASPGASATRHPLGVMVVPRHVVTGMAELLMGGPGDGENRLPNRFERSLLARRLSEVLAPLWEGLGVETDEPPAITFVNSSVAALPMSTIAVAIRFAVGARSWEFTLALASAVLDAGIALKIEPNAPTMARAVKDIPVDVAVTFSPIRVSATDVERLAVGDVIRLDHFVGVPLIAEAQGRPLLLVSHGTTGRRVAVEVLEVLDAAELADMARADAAPPAIERI